MKNKNLSQPKQQLASEFIWRGDDYKNNSTPQQERAYNALLNMNYLKPYMDVIDIGGGDGKISFNIAQKVFPGWVYYVDLSYSMAEKAYSQYKNCSNLSIVQGQAAFFKFHPGHSKADFITSFFCLQWLAKDELPTAFENIYEHLKENGKICILLPCHDFTLQVIKKVAFSYKWKEYFNDYQEPQTFENEEYYHQLLQEKGFSAINITIMKSKHEFTNDEFIRYTQQWCGCYYCLKDGQLQADFLKDICEELNKEKHNEHEKFTITQQSIQIIAQKPGLKISNNMS